MSFRKNAYSKEYLLLNVAESSIHFPRERNVIDEYKRLHTKKKNIEKKLDILLYIKKKGLLTPIRIKLLRHILKKKQNQLNVIEESNVLKFLLQREEERRKKEKQEKERALDEQKAREAEQFFSETPFIEHDDDYYDKLWRSDYEEFWAQVKLEWRAKHPGKTTNDASFSFEKGCEYLSWQLSGAPKSLTIAQMRASIPKERNKPNTCTCIYDVISKYIYHHQFYM